MRQDKYDVIAVGSGVAGLTGALAAAELGLRVIVLEKADQVGGGTALGNTFWVGCNHLAEAEGYEDSRAETLEYMRFVGGGHFDEERLLAFVDESPRALKFFEDCGIPFRLCRGMVDHYYGIVPTAKSGGRMIEVEPISEDEAGPFSGRVVTPRDTPIGMLQEEEIAWGGRVNPAGWDTELLAERERQRLRTRGVGLIIHLVKQLLARGVRIETGIGVERLIVEDGRVAGVVCAGGRRIGAARGVFLATGGYESSGELVERFEGLPGWISMYPASSTGDGLLMAAAIGAATHTVHNNLALFLGFNAAGGHDPADGCNFRIASTYEMPSPHTIVVNRRGERFGDESYFQALVPELRKYDTATHAYANLPCFLVFDAQFAAKFSFGGLPPGHEIPEWVTRVATLPALGAALGIDSEQLAATVERFNRFADAGLDEDFERGTRYVWSLANRDEWEGTVNGNPSLGALREPPFYGIELRPSGISGSGLLTNRAGQVLDQRGAAIAGLYAAGNVAAQTDYGVGYQAGHAFTSAMTVGYLAALDMSGRDAALTIEAAACTRADAG